MSDYDDDPSQEEQWQQLIDNIDKEIIFKEIIMFDDEIEREFS